MVIALALASLLSGPTNSQAILQDGRIESISETEIRLIGIITPNVVSQFKRLITDKTSTVSLSSEGGVTEAALEIAEDIQRRKLEIKVLDLCISSCANYLFVAGAKRTVLPKAVVGWHGGHSFKPFRPSVDSPGRLVEKETLLLREQLLYARSRVSLDLIIYSGLLTLGKTVDGAIQRQYTIWSPSAQELERLGIANLTMDKGRRDPGEVSEFLKSLGFGGQSIYTGDLFTYLPSFLENY
jgi:hypothetical protein